MPSGARRLLQNGIALYELRRLCARHGPGKKRRPIHQFRREPAREDLSVDRARVFIGSFNFDPRSAELNTEMGVVIDSPALGRQAIDTALTARIASSAYEVRLSEDGNCVLDRTSGARMARYDTEPGTDTWQRARVTGYWGRWRLSSGYCEAVLVEQQAVMAKGKCLN